MFGYNRIGKFRGTRNLHKKYDDLNAFIWSIIQIPLNIDAIVKCIYRRLWRWWFRFKIKTLSIVGIEIATHQDRYEQ